MKTIEPLGIKAYEFDELSAETKEKAIIEHIEFWLEIGEYNESNKGNFEKAIDEAEKRRTPWFAGQYIYDYCRKEVIEEIRINNYLFDEYGDLLPIRSHINEYGQITKNTFRVSKNNRIEIELTG